MASSWPKRLISPSGLGFVVLCFFFPFFTVSCSGMLGSLDVTYSGMSLVFNGSPSVSGSLAPELGPDELEDLRPGAQPLVLITLLVLLVGGVLSAALPNPLARTLSALSAAGLALLLAVVNQIGMHGAVEQEIREQAGSDFQFADYSTGSGVGFWLLIAVLSGVVVYNVVDLVLLRRGPAPGVVTAGGSPPGGPPPPGFGPPAPGGQGTGPQAQGPPQGFGPQRPPQGLGPQGQRPTQAPPQGPPQGRPSFRPPHQPPAGPGPEHPPGRPEQPPGGPR